MQLNHLIAGTALLLSAVSMTVVDAWATASDWNTTDFSQVRLISAHDSTAGAAVLDLGVQVRLEDGWKTYWRDPGDAGLPTRFDWSASENVGDVTLLWPAPKRITFEGLDSFGYETEVVFPVRVRPLDPAKAVRINLQLDYALCKEICVPLQASLSVDIPSRSVQRHPATKAYASLIRRYAERIPSRDSAEMTIVAANVAGRHGQKVLRLKATAQTPFESPDVFVEGPPLVFFGRPRVMIGDDRRSVVMLVPIDDAGESPYGFEPLTITLVDGYRAIERSLVPQPE